MSFQVDGYRGARRATKEPEAGAEAHCLQFRIPMTHDQRHTTNDIRLTTHDLRFVTYMYTYKYVSDTLDAMTHEGD